MKPLVRQRRLQRELCTLLSLAAFLLLLAHSESLPAVVALFISLACPVAWLAFLLWDGGDGSGLVQRVRRRAVLLRRKAESEWISK